MIIAKYFNKWDNKKDGAETGNIVENVDMLFYRI